MEIMLTKPPLSPGKPDLRIVKLKPRSPSPVVKNPLTEQPPVTPLDRRQVRLRWD
jgi:hypothetical protein